MRNSFPDQVHITADSCVGRNVVFGGMVNISESQIGDRCFIGRHSEIHKGTTLGPDVKMFGFNNLYGCSIGDETKIGAFVEIQKNAFIGRRCKISSHSFVCEGVTLEDRVFIGHHVCFINDKLPRATTGDGDLKTEADWVCIPTKVKSGASIGSGAVILCGVTIGEDVLIGAGSVVTKDIPAGQIWAGNPAQFVREVNS